MVPVLIHLFDVLVEATSKLFGNGLLAFREKPVIGIAHINIVSDDRPRLIDGKGGGALAGACARARSVKRGEAAALIPDKTVIHIARVNVISCNGPRYTDALGERTL